MKFITAIIAFSIAFGFSAFLTDLLGANNRLHFQAAETNQTAQEISSLLEQDIENGQQIDALNPSSMTLFEYSAVVGDYVDASESIEDVNLPPDFRFAWQAHMTAWRRHADFLNINSLSSNDLDETESRRYASQSLEIRRTWFKVLDIGKKYGAVIPPNAY